MPQGRGRGRPPEPPFGLLPRMFFRVLPQAGGGRDPEVPAAFPVRPGAGLRLRRKGQSRAVGHPDGAGIPDGGAPHRPRDRGVFRALPREDVFLRFLPREGADRRGPARGGGPDSRGGKTGAQGGVLRLRHGQAVLLQPGRRRGGLHGRRHGTQPRRRGGAPAGEPAPLGRRPSLAPAPPAPRGGGRARAEGQAAVARERDGNGGVRLPERDRLRDRGVPDERGRHLAHLQGSPHPHRRGDAGHPPPLLPGLPRP